MSEQDVIQFVEITGATPDDAQRFLEIADNNLDTAVTLYLESGGSSAGGGGEATNQNNTRPASSTSSTNSNSNNRAFDDETLARQLQESERDNVRAPIAPKTDILAGGGPSLFHPPALSSHRQQSTRPSVFNQGDSATGSVADFVSRLQADGQSSSSSPDTFGSPTTAKARRLADLFRPPFDIMFRGSFEEAKEDAKEKNKWLMINIQDPSEFSCQVLNRDLWSDPFVKDIIKASFIFLQYANTSADGVRYANYYSVRKYPHVAIIDSITGESMKVWEKSLSPTDFMMEVTEFLDHHPTAFSTTTNEVANKRAKVSKRVSDMTEEEQLNAAIAASLNNSKSPSTQTSSRTSSVAMDEDIKLGEDKDKGKDKVPVQSEDVELEKVEADDDEDMQAGSAFDAIQPVKRDETTDMTNSTRIQLRIGDGSRIIRRFLKTDPVRYIFEFVKADVPGAQDQAFELVFNRTQLIDVLDQSIAEAGLSNAAVNCVFV
ncbi:hypothetical protein BDF20DRAFT_873538 [Mycotypha africana]|uniref:uncharacterized protein n=1 Tax=Mycotypha africana TaxID=64632 RepID=UPI002300C727|nr:uncharacterized protein BDF20DRAFT_873538 [Mycotypha africana]KAI8977203.1 hypothetical protein BDF20DRAFT_873538 [Mycotypha africana]